MYRRVHNKSDLYEVKPVNGRSLGCVSRLGDKREMVISRILNLGNPLEASDHQIHRFATTVRDQHELNMTTTIEVPKEYGYVVMTTAASFLLCVYHGLRVGPYRRAAKVMYPNYMASAEQIAQADPDMKKRAHSNYLENLTLTSVSMLIAGTQYPLTTTALGVGWLVSRVLYMIGYTDAEKPNGRGRLMGSGFWVCEAVLVGMAGWVGLGVVGR
ncbi:hypothetical protein M501DRAFT_986982 [Patellaria atrata CBS 101060]|uniref:Uncharacterized protein n=1 Tax=Patellaria atrata CBS 101060 TaxID=1346257 RepID=A0A9P4VQP1_9PEZI|nr:hypothetical protein M501DRAFT_986982 [Patellaria atrata CBS 101060]